MQEIYPQKLVHQEEESMMRKTKAKSKSFQIIFAVILKDGDSCEMLHIVGKTCPYDASIRQYECEASQVYRQSLWVRCVPEWCACTSLSA